MNVSRAGLCTPRQVRVSRGATVRDVRAAIAQKLHREPKALFVHGKGPEILDSSAAADIADANEMLSVVVADGDVPLLFPTAVGALGKVLATTWRWHRGS